MSGRGHPRGFHTTAEPDLAGQLSDWAFGRCVGARYLPPRSVSKSRAEEVSFSGSSATTVHSVEPVFTPLQTGFGGVEGCSIRNSATTKRQLQQSYSPGSLASVPTRVTHGRSGAPQPLPNAARPSAFASRMPPCTYSLLAPLILSCTALPAPPCPAPPSLSCLPACVHV